MQLGTLEIISKSQRERLIIYTKYCIQTRGSVIWNSFLNETEKKDYRSISLNVRSKKRYLSLKEN